LISQRLGTKSESDEHTLRLAVLIDADNAQAAVIEGLLVPCRSGFEGFIKPVIVPCKHLGVREQAVGRYARVCYAPVLS
jgi:hypothetical protein